MLDTRNYPTFYFNSMVLSLIGALLLCGCAENGFDPVPACDVPELDTRDWQEIHLTSTFSVRMPADFQKYPYPPIDQPISTYQSPTGEINIFTGPSTPPLDDYENMPQYVECTDSISGQEARFVMYVTAGELKPDGRLYVGAYSDRQHPVSWSVVRNSLGHRNGSGNANGIVDHHQKYSGRKICAAVGMYTV